MLVIPDQGGIDAQGQEGGLPIVPGGGLDLRGLDPCRLEIRRVEPPLRERPPLGDLTVLRDLTS